MWSFHVRVVLSTSPRWRCVRTCEMSVPFIKIVGLRPAFLPINKCLLFGALNNIPNSLPNLLLHPDWRSDGEVSTAQVNGFTRCVERSVISEDGALAAELTESGRSLMNSSIKKSTGLSTVPWGIPDFGSGRVCNGDAPPFNQWHTVLCAEESLTTIVELSRRIQCMTVFAHNHKTAISEARSYLGPRQLDRIVAPQSRAMCHSWTEKQTCVTVKDFVGSLTDVGIAVSLIAGTRRSGHWAVSPMCVQHMKLAKLVCSLLGLYDPSHH